MTHKHSPEHLHTESDPSEALIRKSEEILKRAEKVVDEKNGTKSESVFTEAVILAMAPVIAYALCFVKEAAYYQHFKIPPDLISVDLTSILIASATVLGLFKKRLVFTALGTMFNVSLLWTAIVCPALFVGFDAFLIWDSWIVGVVTALVVALVSYFAITTGQRSQSKLPNAVLGVFDFVYWTRRYIRCRAANALKKAKLALSEAAKTGNEENKTKALHDVKEAKEHAKDAIVAEYSRRRNSPESLDEVVVFAQCIFAFVLLMAFYGWHEARNQEDFLLVDSPVPELTTTPATTPASTPTTTPPAPGTPPANPATLPENPAKEVPQLIVMDTQEKRIICLNYLVSKKAFTPYVVIIGVPDKATEQLRLKWIKLKGPGFTDPDMGPDYNWLE
jgi:hypothetical protein